MDQPNVLFGSVTTDAELVKALESIENLSVKIQMCLVNSKGSDKDIVYVFKKAQNISKLLVGAQFYVKNKKKPVQRGEIIDVEFKVES